MASEGWSSSVVSSGSEKAEEECYRKDEVEEGLEDGGDARDPEAAGAGEEELGEEAVEDEDEENEFEDGAEDLAGSWDAGEGWDERGVAVEAEA
jgi:hypothetical protein